MKSNTLWIMALLVAASLIAGCGDDGSSGVSNVGNGVYNNISTGVRPVIRQE